MTTILILILCSSDHDLMNSSITVVKLIRDKNATF